MTAVPSQRSLATGLCAAAAAFFVTLSSSAQQESNVERADRQFREAQTLVDAGKIGEACSKFAESQRLDPKLGRLLNLADCHDREGKTATAWSEFNAAAAWAMQKNQEERVTFAREQINKLEKRLSLLRLALPPAEELSVVAIDGEAIAKDRWALPLPVDPGDHSVTVSADGKKSRSVSVTVPVGPTTMVVNVPPLEEEATVAPSQATAPAPGPAPAAALPAHDQPAPKDAVPRRTLAWISGGVGIVGLGVGTVLGIAAASKQSDADPHCPGKLCDRQGAALIDTARTDAAAATVALGVGIVGIGVGTWLYVTSSSSVRVTPVALAGGPGLRLEGTW